MFAALLLCGAVAAPPPAAPAIERRLHPATVDASSFLWNDWNKFQENYHPNYVADDDPKTAWTEGAKGNGEGEWLRVPVTKLEGATRVRLRLRNGYHKSKVLYGANARPRQVRFDLLPSKKSQTLELKDVMEWQEVVLEQPAGPFEGVQLTVESVYPGTKYEDTCISDVEVFATATTPDNPAFEKSRFERLLAWKKERVEAAALFKKERAGQMPVASSYDATQVKEPGDWPEDAEHGDALSAMRIGILELQKAQASPLLTRALQVIDQKLAGLEPMQPVPTDKRRLPPVDGLEALDIDTGAEVPPFVEVLLPRQLGFLTSDGVGAFAVKDAPTFAAATQGDAKACNRKGEGTTFGWAAYGGNEPKRVEVLALALCGLVEGREGNYTRGQPALLVYDAKGRLGAVATLYQVSLLSWSDDASPVLQGALVSHRWEGGLRRYEHHMVMAGR